MIHCSNQIILLYISPFACLFHTRDQAIFKPRHILYVDLIVIVTPLKLNTCELLGANYFIQLGSLNKKDVSCLTNDGNKEWYKFISKCYGISGALNSSTQLYKRWLKLPLGSF